MIKSTASDNAFVKKVQAMTSGMAGKEPSMPKEMKNLDAYMSNTGMHAEDLGRKLTSGMDKAYPVK